MRNKTKIYFLFSFFFLLLAFPLIVFAQTAVSNCVITKIGLNPPPPNLPIGCKAPNKGGGGNGTYRWPFPTKDPTQYFRIDQGWDLQYHQQTEVFAIAPGTISVQGGDPRGFGLDYPILTLDAPIEGHDQIYYGHVHVAQDKVGKHVNAGDIIANTDPSGNVWPPNWLEIGFWDSGGPVGRVDKDPASHYSTVGQVMHDWIINIGI